MGWRSGIWAMIRALIIVLPVFPGGCTRSDSRELVVYAALDGEFSEPILKDFGESRGIKVLPKFDVESTKTVGLVEAILAESNRPRCDVFWNNEILHTIRLERAGALERITPDSARDFPEAYRSAEGLWYGFAARARILLVNTNLVDESSVPKRLVELVDAPWRGKVGIAKPLFGTTATHAACLFAAWGDDRAGQFFRDLKQNEVQIMSGNRAVAQAVSAGTIAMGLTDTDDALAELALHAPVRIVYLDQGDDELGTLFIPNTLALIKGAPHSAAAKELIEYLLSPEVEARLALGKSGQIPLNPEVTAKPPVETPRSIRAMAVDFERAADCWPAATKFLREEFSAAE